MKFALLIVLLVGAGVDFSAFANGGGYRRGTAATGSVKAFEPSGVENVQILSEELDIELGESEARVEVRYWMKNQRAQKTRVEFGFPVEIIEELLFGGDDAKVRKNRDALVAKVPQYCRHYLVMADGDAVAHKFQREEAEPVKKNQFQKISGISGWMVSEITFGPGEQKAVTIRYESDYDRQGWYTSNDDRADAPVFRYRLSTGAVWAGPIRQGVVRVRGVGINARHVSVQRPVNRFRQTDEGEWIWNFEDLEPSLDDDITIHAGPKMNIYPRGKHRSGDEWEFVQVGEIWQRWHQDYEVSASSTLAAQKEFSYDAENVRSRDIWGYGAKSGAWSEGVQGVGIGERLEFKIDKPLPLDGIRIRPGYARNEELFRANARPAKLVVTLNGEHRFRAKLDDRNQLQTIPVEGYEKPVETVRLEIADVYPGTHHADTCITSVRFVSRLPGKPQGHRGAR